ncbi:MAG: TIR domain-containing protein [Ruminococcaceae bacterium]|nr:TIR domain-containing protein [Oscillospiraceae bacterium]
MKNKEIFISYKSEEFDDALWVKNQLESNGISCWLAPMSITGGASYASEIPSAIQNCKVFVLILSNAVQKSKWVSRELDQAINADKIIMPFMIEECTLNDEFSFYLSNVQRYFACDNREEAIKKMIAEIKNYIGEKETITEIKSEEQQTPIIQKIQDTEPTAPDEKYNIKKSKTNKIKKTNKKTGIVAALCVVIALIIIIGGCLIGFNIGNKVVIADSTFSKTQYSITIENKEIHQEDINKLTEFEDLNFVYFKNCVLKAENLKAFNENDLLTLELSNCGLTDDLLRSIDFNSFKSLGVLNLNGNDKITDLSVLTPVADTVGELQINNIHSKSFDWLKKFTKLRTIYIDNTGIDNLEYCLGMPYLVTLSANDNKIKNLDGLANTSVLERVYLANNQINDISILENSASTLKKLNADNNKISDATVLSKCAGLNQISMNNNELTSVSWSKELNELTHLYLSDNNINSLDGITQSTKLVSLNISKNKLSKVDGLVFERDSYVAADFSGNNITALKLPDNCHYKVLALQGNPLQDSAFLLEVSGSIVGFDYFENLKSEDLKGSSFYTIYVADCPTNQIVKLETASYKVKLVSSKEMEEMLYK